MSVPYNSQTGQDKYLEETVFKGFKHGVFMDVGAHDGVSINNTLFFERAHGWTGINVEPIKEVFDKLVANRPLCKNLNCAVSSVDGEAEFICNKGYTEMISGLKEQFDPRHATRLQRELAQRGGVSEIIRVPTKRIETICQESSIQHIHYMSIDVEGAEFDVIKSINFDKVFIDVINFENNYDDVSTPIIEYLQKYNYRLLHRGTDIFMIHTASLFRKS